MTSKISTLILAIGLGLFGAASAAPAQAQVLNVLTCTIANTETAEAPGANCAYGGIKRTCTTVGLTTTNTYFCFPGPTGARYVDASNDLVTTLHPGTDGFAWAWSASDAAWWPIVAATGQPGHITTQADFTGGYEGPAFVWGNDTCTGAPSTAWQADNRVMRDPHTAAFWRQGSVASITTCWRWEYSSCQPSDCPAATLFTSVSASAPPTFSNPPYRLAN